MKTNLKYVAMSLFLVLICGCPAPPPINENPPPQPPRWERREILLLDNFIHPDSSVFKAAEAPGSTAEWQNGRLILTSGGFQNAWVWAGPLNTVKDSFTVALVMNTVGRDFYLGFSPKVDRASPKAIHDEPYHVSFYVWRPTPSAPHELWYQERDNALLYEQRMTATTIPAQGGRIAIMFDADTLKFFYGDTEVYRHSNPVKANDVFFAISAYNTQTNGQSIIERAEISWQDSVLVHGDSVRVKVRWNPNHETDLAGYKVLISDSIKADVPVGREDADFIITRHRKHWFNVTAHDSVGNESAKSDTVWYPNDR